MDQLDREVTNPDPRELAPIQRLLRFQLSEDQFRRVLYVALPVTCLVSTVLMLWSRDSILPTFDSFLANLPLMLPVLTVVLSIMLRPDELTRLDGWLNLCNHFALGFVSFSIWAFVAGQSVPKYITINPTMMLNKEHSLLLVFVAFIWAAFCSVVSALAGITKERPRRKWQLLQVALVATSLTFLFMPRYLFERKTDVERKLGISFDEQTFTVIVPFRDPSLDQYMGRSTNPLTQCRVYTSVTARTPREARDKALRDFRKSPGFFQFTQPSGKDREERRTVDVLEALIVASPDGST